MHSALARIPAVITSTRRTKSRALDFAYYSCAHTCWEDKSLWLGSNVSYRSALKNANEQKVIHDTFGGAGYLQPPLCNLPRPRLHLQYISEAGMASSTSSPAKVYIPLQLESLFQTSSLQILITSRHNQQDGNYISISLSLLPIVQCIYFMHII